MPPSNVSSRPIQLLIFRRPNSVSVYPIQDTKLQELAQNLGHTSHYILTNSDIAMVDDLGHTCLTITQTFTWLLPCRTTRSNVLIRKALINVGVSLWITNIAACKLLHYLDTFHAYTKRFGRCNLWSVIPQLIEDHKIVRFRANAIRSPFSGDYWLR
ncbi:hypothetical protein NC651_006028 [Populus alba x Populus x berolinensis]|nr:hypothetical protein NC651_006019 [Populus alba x Populus x berolinensis]KAJ6939733.1 hypothetical protein NC651_006028 [Populus alba x Populus x berolinensis]